MNADTRRIGLALLPIVTLLLMWAFAAPPVQAQEAGSEEKTEEQQAEADDGDEQQDDAEQEQQPPAEDDAESEGQDEDDHVSRFGVTEEELKFIRSLNTANMTPEERQKRDAILAKMRDHARRNRGGRPQKADPKRPGVRPKTEHPRREHPLRPERTRPRTIEEDLPPAGRPPEGASVGAARSESGAAPDGGRPSVPDENWFKPYHERVFAFGLVDGGYEELVQMFARKAGLRLQGVPVSLVDGREPEGTLSYVSTKLTDFETTLNQINDLLYYQMKPPLYLLLREDPDDPRIELHVVNELRRKLPADRVYTSLDAVLHADLLPSDIVRVFFAPEKASDMKVFNDVIFAMLDDQTRAAIDATSGQIDFTGRVDTLYKILDWMERLAPVYSTEKNIQFLAVEHIKPSTAVELLSTLVDNVVSEAADDATPRPRRPRRSAGKEDELAIESEKVVVIADDARKQLLVSGLPYKINEVEQVLEIIDQPELDEDFELPTVVKLEHAKAEEAAGLLNSVVNGTQGAPTPAVRRRAGRRTQSPAAEGDEEQLLVIPEPRTNSLILQGDEKLIAAARVIIEEVIDNEAPADANFRLVEIENGGSEEIVQVIAGIYGKPRRKGEDPLSVQASGDFVVLSGDPAQMDEAEQLIKSLDTMDSEPEDVFIAHLENAEPSVVVEILKMKDSSAPATSKPRRGRRRAVKGAADSRFYADDTNGMVFFTGTEAEWTGDIFPLIQKIDKEAKTVSSGELIRLDNADAKEVVDAITPFFQGKRKGTGAKFVPTPQGILVGGDVTRVEMNSIRETVALMDEDVTDTTKQEFFYLTFADPQDVVKAIQDLFGGAGQRPRRGRKQAGPDSQIRTAVAPQGVIVIADQDELPPIAALIDQMDQPESTMSVVLKRFVIENADAEQVAAVIEPLLQSRHSALFEGDRKKAVAAKNQLSVQFDTRTNSVMVSAPQVVVDYAAEIIKPLDEEMGEAQEKVIEIYECVNASASDLASILSQIFDGGTVTPATPKGRKRARSALQRRLRQSREQGDISIIPLPGEKAISISAPRDEVADILERARELDEKSKSTEPDMRVFQVLYADVDEVADAIIEMLDEPSRRVGAKATEDDMFFDWEPSGPKRGKEISVWSNYETKTLMVYAPPAKMVAVEALINESDAIAKGDEYEIDVVEPFEFVTIEHVSALEAQELVDRYLFEIFPSTPPVSLGYIDKDTLVLKGNRKYFNTVRQILTERVDRPQDSDKIVYSFQPLPPGIDAEEFLQMVQSYMDIEIEVQNLTNLGKTRPEELVEEVQ